MTEKAPFIEELGDIVYLVPLSNDDINAVCTEYSYMYYPNNIPAGYLTAVQEDMPYIGLDGHYQVHRDCPESLVYAITRVLHDNFDEWLTYDVGLEKGRLPEALTVRAQGAPYHVGAIKYYKEKGYWTADHQKAYEEELAELGETK